MKSILKRRGRLVLVAAVVAVLATASGLSVKGASAAKRSNVTLTIDVFGDFGYHDLYKQYEASHPGITIKEDTEDYARHHAALAQHLATGAGADDIEAIEVGFIANYTTQSRFFVDLRQYGAAKLKKRYPSLEVSAGRRAQQEGDRPGHRCREPRHLLPDGPVQEGGPADEAGGAREAVEVVVGLPRRGQALSEACAGGHQVHRLREQSLQRDGRAGHPRLLLEERQGDRQEQPDRSRPAWNTTMQAIKLQQDQGLVAFHADWNAGFKNGTFATVTCPAWMMGYIQGQAPDASGKWNIADVPGGGGNWGGSFLTVTKQSQHQKEAAALVKFLTSPKSETVRLQAHGEPAERGSRAEEQSGAEVP